LTSSAGFLLAPGDQAWIEDPGYSGAFHTLRTTGAGIVPVPADGDGVIVKAGRKLAPKAKLAYVTPVKSISDGLHNVRRPPNGTPSLSC
jgi:GntR family transcriptional regulator/MocR family aminotransferase